MTPKSPLRYPGGKSKLANYLKQLILNCDFKIVNYVEPFAGGSAIALDLLITGVVDRIFLNDLDIAIYSLWFVILNNTDELIDKIRTTEINVDNWRTQKMILNNKENANILDLGFATLFLNRTNRSGILKANPIGGVNQNGSYKMDCRFNKERIIKQIQVIASHKENITLSNQDAKKYIDELDKKISNAFFYLDPPYVSKGHQLYTNSYNESDHIDLFKQISILKNTWFVTYDDCKLIEILYSKYRQNKFTLNYSVETKRKGTEIAIYCNQLKVIPKFE